MFSVLRIRYDLCTLTLLLIIWKWMFAYVSILTTLREMNFDVRVSLDDILFCPQKKFSLSFKSTAFKKNYLISMVTAYIFQVAVFCWHLKLLNTYPGELWRRCSISKHSFCGSCCVCFNVIFNSEVCCDPFWRPAIQYVIIYYEISHKWTLSLFTFMCFL